MPTWTHKSLADVIANNKQLTATQLDFLLHYMNEHFPPELFERQLAARRKALENASVSRNLLEGTRQHFPEFLSHKSLSAAPGALKGWAIVLTAGGEGERLRLSLLAQGIPARELENFTKATYPLKGFYNNYGTLHVNLAMISHLSKAIGLDIPVIITTGPDGSITQRVIPRIIAENNGFGLKKLRLVSQEERLHFTLDEKIAIQMTDDLPYPVTQPDETGGPLMKLKQKSDTDSLSALEWISSLNCRKIIVAQATALYDPAMLPLMAKAGQNHDCLGVGILRSTFEPKDPFGTFVNISKVGRSFTCIIEQDIRNDVTRSIKDESGAYHLPFNTGFYAMDCALLENNTLPDYATPPKEILPDLPRSPKVGYAATDIFPMAENPLVLTLDPTMFGVIKTAADLENLTEAGIRYGLREICKDVAGSI